MKTFARGGKRKTSPHNGASRRDLSLDDGGLAALYGNASDDDHMDDNATHSVAPRRAASYDDGQQTEGSRAINSSNATGRFGAASVEESEEAKQPAVNGNGRPAAHDSAEVWKRKYQDLKVDYENLLHDYETLLGAAEKSPTAMKEQLHAKEARIIELEAALEDATAAAASQGSQVDAGNAAKKIENLNEEIQKLLEQRIALEAELAELRFGATRGPVPSMGSSGGGGTFEQERLINNLKAQLREKDEEIEDLTAELNAAKAEITRLGGVMGIVAGQVERSEKRRKKAWFKRKRDPKDLSAAELEELAKETAAAAAADGSVVGGDESDRTTSKPSAAQSILSKPALAVAQHPHLVQVAHPGDLGGVVVNKRLLELERENARLEGEIEILQREKSAIADKADRLAAQQEALTRTIQTDEANRRLVDVSHGGVLPLPRDGGSETDQLRALVRLQEAALKKLSLQNQQLEASLRVTARPPAPQSPSQQDAIQARQEASMLRRTLTETRSEALSARSVATTAMAENEQLRRTLSTVRATHREAVQKLRAQAADQASMLSNLMAENERLRDAVRRAAADASVAAQSCALQSRAANEQREAALKPPLFQTPQVLAAVQPPLPLRARCSGEPHIITRVVVEKPDAEEKPPPESPSPPEPAPPSEPPGSQPPAMLLREEPLEEDDDDTATLEPEELTPRPLAASGLLQYKWTDVGYALCPAAMQAESRVRPAVQVEPPRVGGPFPVDPANYALSPLAPEVSETDQTRCQNALRMWLAQGHHATPPRQRPQYVSQPVVVEPRPPPPQRFEPSPPPVRPPPPPVRQRSSSSESITPPPRSTKLERSLVSKIFDDSNSVETAPSRPVTKQPRPVFRAPPEVFPRPTVTHHHHPPVTAAASVNETSPSLADPQADFISFNPSAVGSLAPVIVTDKPQTMGPRPRPAVSFEELSPSPAKSGNRRNTADNTGMDKHQQPPPSPPPLPKQEEPRPVGTVDSARGTALPLKVTGHQDMAGIFGTGAVSDSDEDVAAFEDVCEMSFGTPTKAASPPAGSLKDSDAGSSNGIRVVRKTNLPVDSAGSSNENFRTNLGRIGPPLVD